MVKPTSIPRPLVRTNQWTIVLSVSLALLTHDHWIMLIPFIAGLLGIVFHFNPVLRIARLFFRKQPSEYIPEDAKQQGFNQYIALICLFLSLAGFALHSAAVGYVFSVLVALTAFIAILGFCVGCFIRFQWSQYRYRRSARTQSRHSA